MDISAVSSSARYQFAKNLIGEAGQMALAYFSDLSQLEIEKKGHQDLVSQADKNVEIFIREHISAQFPDDGIIGEEGGSFIGTSSSDSGYRWVIDPIDGTRSFVAGKYDFGTLIAIVENNEVIAGVIDCPALEERWSCFGDSFTEVNGRKTQCKSVQKLEDAVMATTSSHEFGMQKWRSYQSLEKSVKVTTTGSDCYNYGLLASGHIDLIAEKLTAPHDYLPLTKIVEGAGGIMTDWEGKKLGLHDKHVYVLASASEELHNLALEKLRTKE